MLLIQNLMYLICMVIKNGFAWKFQENRFIIHVISMKNIEENCTFRLYYWYGTVLNVLKCVVNNNECVQNLSKINLI